MTAGKSRLIINKVKMIVLSDFKEPDSAIRHQQNNTKAVMDQRELGVGTLYITERLDVVYCLCQLRINMMMFLQYAFLARTTGFFY